jgi:hypothetical protein
MEFWSSSALWSIILLLGAGAVILFFGFLFLGDWRRRTRYGRLVRKSRE